MSIIYEALKKMSRKNGESPLGMPSAQNGPQDESNLAPKPTSSPAMVKPRSVFSRMRRSFVLALSAITAVILITRLITNKPTTQSSHNKIKSVKQTSLITAINNSQRAAGTHPLERRTRSAKEKLSASENHEFILNGIVLSLDGNLALINAEILKVGDDILGAKVEEIIDQQVTLTFQGKKIILKKR